MENEKDYTVKNTEPAIGTAPGPNQTKRLIDKYHRYTTGEGLAEEDKLKKDYKFLLMKNINNGLNKVQKQEVKQIILHNSELFTHFLDKNFYEPLFEQNFKSDIEKKYRPLGFDATFLHTTPEQDLQGGDYIIKLKNPVTGERYVQYADLKTMASFAGQDRFDNENINFKIGKINKIGEFHSSPIISKDKLTDFYVISRFKLNIDSQQLFEEIFEHNKKLKDFNFSKNELDCLYENGKNISRFIGGKKTIKSLQDNAINIYNEAKNLYNSLRNEDEYTQSTLTNDFKKQIRKQGWLMKSAYLNQLVTFTKNYQHPDAGYGYALVVEFNPRTKKSKVRVSFSKSDLQRYKDYNKITSEKEQSTMLESKKNWK